MYKTLSDNHAEIFHGGGIKRAFGDLERKSVFSETRKDMMCALVM